MGSPSRGRIWVGAKSQFQGLTVAIIGVKMYAKCTMMEAFLVSL